MVSAISLWVVVIATARDSGGDAAEAVRYLEIPLGFVQAAIHRRQLGRGVVGAAALPYLILFEWLAPAFVAFGLVIMVLGLAIGFLNLYAQVVLLALVLILAILMSLVSVLTDQLSYNVYGGRLDWPLFGALVLENLGYRQLVWLAGLAGMWAWFWRRPVRPGATAASRAPRPPRPSAAPTGRDHRPIGPPRRRRPLPERGPIEEPIESGDDGIQRLLQRAGLSR